MSEFVWEPWVEFRQALAEELPIERPPCEHCKHWYPHREYDGPVFSGVAMCCAEEMYGDFSCFEVREG